MDTSKLRRAIDPDSGSCHRCRYSQKQTQPLHVTVLSVTTALLILNKETVYPSVPAAFLYITSVRFLNYINIYIKAHPTSHFMFPTKEKKTVLNKNKKKNVFLNQSQKCLFDCLKVLYLMLFIIPRYRKTYLVPSSRSVDRQAIFQIMPSFR